MENSKKHENFVRLAQKRTTDVLVDLRKLRKLSARNNYEWTDDEIEKIFSAIRNELNDAYKDFKRNTDVDEDPTFTL